MAQNYTQTTYTQAFVARRNADAILTIAPFTAAISVSPPLSNVEKLEARVAVVRRNGLVCMHMSWGRGRDHDDRATCGSPTRGPGRSATADRAAGNCACADRYS